MDARYISRTGGFAAEAAGLGLLLIVIACGFLQARGWFTSGDQALMRAVGVWRLDDGAAFTPVAVALSRMTDVPGRLVMLALLALIFLWRRRLRRWIWLAVVAISAMLLNTALKHFFAAARPDLIAHLDPTLTYSFPSGHASGNAAFFGALAMVVGTRAGWIAAVAVIALIGVSRVWLGVHWPSDVVCGWLEGAGILLVARRWLPRG